MSIFDDPIIMKAIKAHFHFILKHPCEYKGLPRKLDKKVKIDDSLVFDADRDIPAIDQGKKGNKK
jgi:hypothetical protein